MNATDAIGWFASAILIATVSRQVWKQWRERRIEGVSRWLFIGQMATSAAFIVYSVLLHNWVFVTSNVFLLIAAVTGEVLRRRIEAEENVSSLHAESAARERGRR
jgi:MtN3 and saliva related transmembrane protein